MGETVTSILVTFRPFGAAAVLTTWSRALTMSSSKILKSPGLNWTSRQTIAPATTAATLGAEVSAGADGVVPS